MTFPSIRNLATFLVAFFICSAILFSCVTRKNVHDRQVDREVITIVTTDTIRDSIPYERRILVPVKILDTTKLRIHGDSIRQATIDSITAGLKDLMTLSLKPISGETKFAKAEAGLKHNKLYLVLTNKPIDTVLYHEFLDWKEHKIINKHTETTDRTTDVTKSDTVIEQPFFKNNWFWAFICLFVLCLSYALLTLARRR